MSSQTVQAARKAFVAKYGKETRDVVQAIARGWDNQRIQDKLMVSSTSVAAYRANVTRESYAPFVLAAYDGSVTGGTCQF